jgi:hypothetical protein
MTGTTIEHGKGYKIVTHGNGLACTITLEKTGEERFLQGDDAASFLAEYDNLEKNPMIGWSKLLDLICGAYFD